MKKSKASANGDKCPACGSPTTDDLQNRGFVRHKERRRVGKNVKRHPTETFLPLWMGRKRLSRQRTFRTSPRGPILLAGLRVAPLASFAPLRENCFGEFKRASQKAISRKGAKPAKR